MIENIAICEPVCRFWQHAPVNAAVLEIVQLAYPEATVHFFADSTHDEVVRTHLPDEAQNFISHNITIPKWDESFRSRLPTEIPLVYKVLSFKQCNQIIFTNSRPATLATIKTLRKFQNRNGKIQIFMHGTWSRTTEKLEKSLSARICQMRYLFDNFSNKNITYIALEDHIQKNLRFSFPHQKEHIRVLEHPLNSIYDQDPEVLPLAQPVRFGFLGWAGPERGFEDFLDCARKITQTSGNQAEFYFAGQLPAVLKGIDLSPVIQISETRPERTLFMHSVLGQHFICLFHQRKKFKLTASGAVLDAVSAGKPLIARAIPLFENLFDKYGDIGYLFNNRDECIDILNSIINQTDSDRYQRQVDNILRIKRDRVPESLASHYFNFTEEIRAQCRRD